MIATLRKLLICCTLLKGLVPLAQASDMPPDYAKTKYPIILVHGMFGFDQMLGTIDYFYKVPQTLNRLGADVYIVRLNGVDSTKRRSESLLSQIEDILAITGKEKVHIFGHSHGAINARYVASVRPDLVASVVSVSGPHKGSRVADLVYGYISRDTWDARFAEDIINLAAFVMNKMSKTPARATPNIKASLKSLTSKEMNRFNEVHPFGLPSSPCQAQQALANNGVEYYSFSGTNPKTNRADLFDLVFILASKVAYKNQRNDGLVERCSSHLGEVIRDDFDMNHLDSVNLFFGLVDADPLPVYVSIAHGLKEKGL